MASIIQQIKGQGSAGSVLAGLIRNQTCLLKFWAMINCFGVVGMFNGQDALSFWCSGRSPLMKITTPCGQGVFKGREMLGMP